MSSSSAQPVRRASSARNSISLQRVAVERQVVRRVLDRDRPADRVLDLRDVAASSPAPRACAETAAGRAGSAPPRRDQARCSETSAGSNRADQRGQRRQRAQRRAARRRRATARRHAARADGARGSPRARPAAARPRPCSSRHGPRTTGPARRAGERLVEVLGLEAESGGRAPACGMAGARQALGVSEPLPLGVLIAVQVPLATFFQALPW